MSTEKATEVPLLSVKATEKSTARTEAPRLNRGRAYVRIIAVLNRDRDRAKGRDGRAVKKRAAIRELIEWLGNDPAFLWEEERRKTNCLKCGVVLTGNGMKGTDRSMFDPSLCWECAE